MNRLPATPVTDEQWAWMMKEKKRRGESYSTILRDLINYAMVTEKAQEAKSNENNA